MDLISSGMSTASFSEAPADISEEGRKPACPGTAHARSSARRSASVWHRPYRVSSGLRLQQGPQTCAVEQKAWQLLISAPLSTCLCPLCRPQSISQTMVRPGRTPLPSDPFQCPSLTFLANWPLVSHGPLLSSESGNSRHSASSLGPCFPWSPGETCTATEIDVSDTERVDDVWHHWCLTNAFSKKTKVQNENKTHEKSRAPTWISWGTLGPHLSLCPWGASPSLWTRRPWLDSNLLGDSCYPWRSQRTGGTWKGKRKAS